MDDVVAVAVLERAHDLLEEAARLVLGHLAAPDDVVEQLAREVLDHHNYVGGGRDDVVAVCTVSMWRRQRGGRAGTHSLMM